MHDQGPLLSVIVPTFNEARNVELLVGRLLKILEGIEWEVIFVDDNSPDGTAAEIRKIGRDHVQVRCLQRIGRRGLSTACIEGMLASNAPYLAVMDCDFQHDPAVLRVMYEMLASGLAELVVGSRYIDGGSCGNWSKQRREISKLATRLSRLVLSQNVMDPMSNFFALRRELFDEAANDLSGLSFKILLDLMLTVGRPVRFCEIPIVLGQRSAGESKFEIIVAWEFGMLLADKTIGRYIPMRFLLLLANGAILGGTFLAGYVLTYKGVGLGFVSSGVMAVLGSMVTTYGISNVVAYQDRRRHGVSWLRGLLAFFVLNGVGAAASVVLATYLFNTGAGWFFAVAAGMLLWLAWDFSGASSQRWRLGGQFVGSVRRTRDRRRRRSHVVAQ